MSNFILGTAVPKCRSTLSHCELPPLFPTQPTTRVKILPVIPTLPIHTLQPPSLRHRTIIPLAPVESHFWYACYLLYSHLINRVDEMVGRVGERDDKRTYRPPSITFALDVILGSALLSWDAAGLCEGESKNVC